jgi:hypothetical protein
VSDVFLSCAREDEERIAQIVEKLTSLGLDLWPASGAKNGENWDDAEIGRQLGEAKAVLVCWTKNSLHSVRVNGEASVAQSNGKLLSCLLEDCKAPSHSQLSEICDLSSWDGKADHPGWRDLIERLSVLIGRPGLSALAGALGAASDRELLAWTQRFAEDPRADRLRGEIEKRERARFEEEMNSARAALADATKLFEQSKNSVLDACSADFEKWIGDLKNASYDARPSVSGALASPEWIDAGALQRLAGERDAASKEAQSAAEARNEAIKRAQIASEVRDAALKRASRAEAALATAEAEQSSATQSRRAPAWLLAACLASALAGGLGYKTVAGSGADAIEQAKQQVAQSTAELAAARDSLKIQDQTIAELQAKSAQSAHDGRDVDAQLKRKNAELDEKAEALKAANEKAARLQTALNSANGRIDDLPSRTQPANASAGEDKTASVAASDSDQARQALKFNTFDSGDLQGKDLGKLTTPSAQDCAAACRNNPACRAYSYDKWNHLCFPKASIGALRLEPRAISGVMIGSPNPKLATTRMTMERYQGRAFPGAGFKTSSAASSAICSESCKREEACVAYTYFWSSRKCQLYESTGEYFPSEEAESGGKKQAHQ